MVYTVHQTSIITPCVTFCLRVGIPIFIDMVCVTTVVLHWKKKKKTDMQDIFQEYHSNVVVFTASN